MDEKNTQKESLIQYDETEKSQTQINDKQEKQKETASFSYVLNALIIFGVCFISCLFVFQIVLKPVDVFGRSMQPTLNASAKGELYQLDTDIVYYFSTTKVTNGDIIILKEGLSKKDPTSKLIKRVIATAGQTITLTKNGNSYFDEYYYEYIPFDVYVDGKLLTENYINKTQTPAFETSNPYHYQHHDILLNALESEGTYSITIPEGQIFVMGDNRCHSTDSRDFGPVSIEEYVMGKIVLHVPFGKNLFQAIWDAIF